MKAKSRYYLICLFLFTAAFLLLSLIQPYHSLSGRTGETVHIEAEDSVIQTFFPLTDKVTSVRIFSAVTAAAKIRLYSNDTGTMYFEDLVQLKPGRNSLRLREPLQNSENHEFYMEIASMSGAVELYTGQNDMPDDHLIINGHGESRDIAMEVISRTPQSIIWAFIQAMTVLAVFLSSSFFQSSQTKIDLPSGGGYSAAIHRQPGLDAIRVAGCIGILVYHVFPSWELGYNESFYRVIVYGASYCIPLLFLLNGYLYFCRPKTEIEEIEAKCREYVFAGVSWSVLKGIVGGILFGEEFTLSNILGSFWGDGNLNILWFFSTILLIWIFFARSLGIFYRENQDKFIKMAAAYLLLLVLFQSWLLMDNSSTCALFFKHGLPQWARLHLYVGFWMLGGAIRALEGKIKWKRSYLMVLLFSTTMVYLIWVFRLMRSDAKIILPEEFYGTPIYMVWLISLFILIKDLPYKEGLFLKFVNLSGRETLVVLATHLSILNVLSRYWTFTGTFEKCLVTVFLFISGICIAEGMKRIPVLRKMVR